MLPHHRLTLRAITVASLSLAACGGGGPTSYSGQNPPPTGQQPPASTSSTITVENTRFDPSSTTVDIGATVTWTWDSCDDDGYGGRTCIEHSVTFDNGPSSGPRSTGSFTRQFNAAGTFNYRCTNHASMTGQVVVR
jgi:plastocyanin